ncbi:MAG: hypothetical protein IKN99_06915 [Bacteroidales bacterium]|nr:hypothetical protein [Bacteroidales bacterium]
MMKRIFILLGIILATFCQPLFGQVERDYHLDKDNLSFFKEAELVVEGRFLKPLHAYAVKDADDKEHYYGICPVIAYRVFKGDAKPGDTIYVTREGTSLEEAVISPYNDNHGYIDERTGIHIIEDILYVAPAIAGSKNINVLNHFQNDCVMFFKASSFPKTKDSLFNALTQYQYLYPFVFYDEGTKLYVSEGKFAGLNDTIFNSRQELYDFMRKVGGYDTTVIGSGAPPKVQTNPNESHHKVIQYGPPSKAPSNKKWTSSYSDKPLPPEVEKRWGKKGK